MQSILAVPGVPDFGGFWASDHLWCDMSAGRRGTLGPHGLSRVPEGRHCIGEKEKISVGAAAIMYCYIRQGVRNEVDYLKEERGCGVRTSFACQQHPLHAIALGRRLHELMRSGSSEGNAVGAPQQDNILLLSVGRGGARCY